MHDEATQTLNDEAEASVSGRQTPPSHEPVTMAETQESLAPASSEGGRFSEQVRSAVAAALMDGDASVRAVAERLAVSGRTLQRRLQHRNTTLQEVVALVRCDLAKQMLLAPSGSVAEVARVLGFSAPSAFHRAFKRWTGMTPGAYRRARRHSAPTIGEA